MRVVPTKFIILNWVETWDSFFFLQNGSKLRTQLSSYAIFVAQRSKE